MNHLYVWVMQRLNIFFRDILQLFVTAELIKWSRLCEVYETELRSNATTVFPSTDEGNDRWGKLKNRVVEHVGFIY